MKTTIVYLHPKGAGLFRSELRSDTLWGAICWALRLLEGPQRVKQFIEDCEQDEPEKALSLSSAFPFVEQGKDKIVHFLPRPMEPHRPLEHKEDERDLSPAQAKVKMREHKKQQKQSAWMSWEHFSYHFCGQEPDLPAVKAPKLDTRAMTHNAIDRRVLGTMDAAGGGQLFHTEERYLNWPRDSEDSTGLYFMVNGNVNAIVPALRLLEHLGIAGDRATGKGFFKISWAEAEVPEPAEPNARLCLSFYHPDGQMRELKALDQEASPNWRYRLVGRRGRNSLVTKYVQNGFYFFGEGSVFPLIPEMQGVPGQIRPVYNSLTDAQADGLDHVPHRYGRAFMLNIHVK